jgi:tetratricopeptide (TPR) repeat protein
MNQDHTVAKVELLIKYEKFVEAEKLLAELLGEDPNNILYLALLAESNLKQNKINNAYQHINHAIGLSPDSPFLFFTKALIAIEDEKIDMAENCINEAIALDPLEADYIAMLANIKLFRKNFDDALEHANKALALEAENLLALNVRSTALLKLNRSEESVLTIEGALREDPNNAFTHANYGWGLLEKGDPKKALIHFKESLSKDPDLEYAQAGMLEAIKATNIFYRLFLKYAFWMGNLTAKYQWAVIIGFYLCFNFLNKLAKSSTTLGPFINPILILLAIIAFSTWVIQPIGNLFLRFNKYGRLLLNQKEKLSSNFVAVSFGLFLIGGLLYLFLLDEKFLGICIFGFTMMLPLGTMFTPSKNRNILVIYSGLLALLGLVSIFITFTTGELSTGVSSIYLIGFIAYQWVANYIIIKD